MKLEPFKLERYFAAHEFTAEVLLSCSDCEPLRMSRLVEMADAESRALWDGLALSYTEAQGHPLLRGEIAGLYDTIDPSQVLVAAPEECIYLTMHAVLRPGDHVVCMVPGYQSLYAVAQSIGCEVSMWMPQEKNAWTFEFAGLSSLLRPTTRMIVVNSPHNPTGAVIDEETLLRVVEAARDRSAILFSDEMYRGLEHGECATLPSACDLYEDGVTLGGLSKAYGLPGLRLGWIATRHDAALSRVAELKDYTTICHSAPSEILALMALRSRQVILEEQRTRLRSNLEALRDFVETHSGWFAWREPRGASVSFPRLLGGRGAGALCQRLVTEFGIMLLPSEVFDFGDEHVRIGFGRSSLTAALERLGRALEAIGGG